MVLGKTYKTQSNKLKWKPKANKNNVKKALKSTIKKANHDDCVYDDIEEVEDNFEKFERKR
jgi:uncharacterized protein (UPF0248 family)|tara:strand:- start:239 stop:421 length:183 start_codon:yes stop_codon:yes gene_type:complete